MAVKHAFPAPAHPLSLSMPARSLRSTPLAAHKPPSHTATRGLETRLKCAHPRAEAHASARR
eukprot:3453781-Rhodomonas_salina.1